MPKNAKSPDDLAGRRLPTGVDCPAGEDAPQSADADSRLVGIVEQHHEAVYRYAFRLSGSSHDAEDLTQQTFLIAREKIDQLRDVEAAGAWLFVVLRNCFLKDLRRQRPLSLANLDATLAGLAALPGTDTVDREALQHALDQLSVEFRLPLLLFYFEDLSYREIASALGIPVGTVMSRLARAKDHLRRHWLKDEEPPRPAPLASLDSFSVEHNLAP